MGQSFEEINKTVERLEEKINNLKNGDKEELTKKSSEDESSPEMPDRSRLDREQLDGIKNSIEDTKKTLKDELWEKIQDPKSSYPGFQSGESERDEEDSEDEKVSNNVEKSSEKSKPNYKQSELANNSEKNNESQSISEKDKQDLNRLYDKIEFTRNKIIDGNFRQATKMYNSLLKEYKRLDKKGLVDKRHKKILKTIYSNLNKG